MKNKFEIGIFGLNSSSGIAMTKVKNRWKAQWDDIVYVTQICDKSGIDFIFSVQRWLGFQGATDPAGMTYDSLSFCSALATLTNNIKLVTTLHVPIIHPTFAARSISTIDQISKGRMRLNIVCGWNKKEFNMFGIKDHQYIDRYEQGEEWISFLKRILKKNKFKPFKGKYFNIDFSTSSPKLYKNLSPYTISAAFSKGGRLFAAKNCNAIITMFSNILSAKKQSENIKKMAKKYNNKIKVLGLAHVVCRETDEEANNYYDYYASKMADKGAIDNFISNLNQSNKNIVLPTFQREQIKKMAGGIGSFPLIGSPATILEKINSLKKNGLNGLALSFVNYREELPFFINKVFKKI